MSAEKNPDALAASIVKMREKLIKEHSKKVREMHTRSGEAG